MYITTERELDFTSDCPIVVVKMKHLLSLNLIQQTVHAGIGNDEEHHAYRSDSPLGLGSSLSLRHADCFYTFISMWKLSEISVLLALWPVCVFSLNVLQI